MSRVTNRIVDASFQYLVRNWSLSLENLLRSTNASGVFGWVGQWKQDECCESLSTLTIQTEFGFVVCICSSDYSLSNSKSCSRIFSQISFLPHQWIVGSLQWSWWILWEIYHLFMANCGVDFLFIHLLTLFSILFSSNEHNTNVVRAVIWSCISASPHPHAREAVDVDFQTCRKSYVRSSLGKRKRERSFGRR